MPSDKELVVYMRTTYCPYIAKAQKVFEQYHIAHRDIMIDKSEEATKRVEAWTGFRSVPTIIVARRGEDVPYEDPSPLPAGGSPRGVDRGSMITEPYEEELVTWLRRHGFIG